MNWRIKRLQERRAALLQSTEKILEACAKDQDREPTEQESATISANKKELEEIAAKLSREQELASYQEAHRSEAIVNDGFLAEERSGRVGNARTACEEDPQKGFRTAREFLMAVMANSDLPAHEVRDERLRVLATAGSDEAGGYSDPYGGFLVPVGFSPDMLKIQAEADPIAGRTTNVPMTNPSIEIPARVDKDHSTSVSGGLTVCRRAETQSQSATRMQMEKIRLTAYSLFGLAYATEEILMDSPISFAAVLEAGFRDQFTYHLIDERLNGTGVGEMEGIMKSPCLVTASADANQTADTITGTNILAMRSRCWGYAKAIWLANHDCLPQLAQVHLKTSGNYPISIYQPSLQEDRPDMLLGRPIFYTEYTQTVGNLGDLVLANWAEYLECNYQPLQSAESVHVRFLNHERTFKFWLRNGGKCWWRSALTPKNSSNTLSPFVVLAAR